MVQTYSSRQTKQKENYGKNKVEAQIANHVCPKPFSAIHLQVKAVLPVRATRGLHNLANLVLIRDHRTTPSAFDFQHGSKGGRKSYVGACKPL